MLKGDFCFCSSPTLLTSIKDGYFVCVGGKCAGTFETLPPRYADFTLIDRSGCLIFPGLTALRIHAPPVFLPGTAMHLELIDWLNNYAFSEEAKFADCAYADRAYTIFADAIRKSATTRACIFATRHRKATELLMDEMAQSSLATYVGKANMDRESTKCSRKSPKNLLN